MTFISGWAGFREIFDKIPQKSQFFIPFVDFRPDQISDILSLEDNLLIGWSLGAHLILKYSFYVKAKKVLLLAPFLYFCDFVNKRILDRMILAFERDKSKVVSEFLKNIGAVNYTKVIPDSFIPDSLKEGLEFLKTSRVEKFEKKENYFCVCAKHDFLKLSGACFDICKNPIIIDSNHFFSEVLIEHIIKKLY
ncbi:MULTISPECIES: hypothetical protein [Desulfurella]|uniref:Biotin synthesis protein BioG n=1 Tax=Desulfurella multipotens TaxID=79269 RepID=A0A1G6MFB6_9BACT|nr:MULTISPECIES: hypothetical protein [Desulfurella]PMP88711.1 MAG: hypothetical protein C0173_06725 [Desulfurella sp.]SDC54318.1 hypothetical protein SAMN05660835_00982 [Desulfurella multipotens]HEX13368.1 hypothetical protein [Desulfurella acetivorans]